MSERTLHHGRGYFDAMYAESLDPWGFESRWYERRKFQLTIAALPRPRYRHAVEPGCARGTLTELLAERCDQVTAYDFVPDVLAVARVRFASRPKIEILDLEFPLVPEGHGDLAVWSEVAYYLTDAGWKVAVEHLLRWLEPGGDLVAVHYTGPTDYPRSGHDVAHRLDQVTQLQRLVSHTDDQFELGVWRRTDVVSTSSTTRTQGG
ncbi:MAG TPA: class I SAM-dependent methyltransferase [Ilumatobacter sp.]|nr:class I SAM-dependent methyltransferase [Ilumatobacter sp.]